MNQIITALKLKLGSDCDIGVATVSDGAMYYLIRDNNKPLVLITKFQMAQPLLKLSLSAWDKWKSDS